MLFNTPLIEWIGYVGSVIVAVSLTMSSIKKLRWYNLVGAAVFSFYGFAIGALPVGLLNLFISLADIYYLFKMYSYHESFKSIQVTGNDSYLNYFIGFYQREINEFFPNFNSSILTGKEVFALLLLRNEAVAGVFIGIKENKTLIIQLDFVTAAYRDLKPGNFIYKKNIDQIKEQGIHYITCKTDNKSHQKYLLKMGFETTTLNSDIFQKNI
jgi:hypothetical protein